MKPTIGILVTYHNEKDMLTECLNSIFSQTRIPDEVLVYDDFSEFPAQDYIPKNYKLDLIRASENNGPGYARNYLLAHSRCEYVHFHDTDDLLLPLWCEKICNAIESTGADVIFTEVSTYEHNRLLSKDTLGLRYLANGENPVSFATSRAILTIASVVRRKIALGIGGFRAQNILPQSEDYDFYIRLLATGVSHAEILESLAIQRLRSDSHSSRNIIEAWNSALKSIMLLSKELPLEYHGYLSEAAARAGSKLYHLATYEDADKAFKLAYSLGKPKFLYRNWPYRIVAKIFGPYTAEKISRVYRTLVPEFVRRKFLS